MLYIGLAKGKHVKIFVSETTRTKALIFRIKHHLVDHHQVSSNYVPRTENRPAPGSHVLHRLI